MPAGRPSKWDDKYVGICLRLALTGKTDPEIAEVLGVSRATLNAWKRSHPELLDALNSGRAPADGRVAASLFQRALGYSHPEEKVFLDRNNQVVRVTTTRHYPPDTMAAIYWLNNRQRAFWYQTQARKPKDVEDPQDTAQSVADALREMGAIDGIGFPPATDGDAT